MATRNSLLENSPQGYTSGRLTVEIGRPKVALQKRDPLVYIWQLNQMLMYSVKVSTL